MEKPSKKEAIFLKTFSKQQEDYFKEVYEKYFDRLFGYALVITRQESLAKDVVSEVFFNLWNAKTDLLSIKKLKSYLFISVKNQALRVLSSDSAYSADLYEAANLSIDQLDPEELLLGKELEQFLDQVLQKLPPQCALVFRMVKEENMKYEDVAVKLAISKDTVKYHLKTALKTFRVELDRHFAEDTRVMYIARALMIFMM